MDEIRNSIARAKFLLQGLQESLAEASPLQALLILPLIDDTADIVQRLEALEIASISEPGHA